MVQLTGHAEDMGVYRKYIQMALSIGLEHFSKDMEEVYAFNKWGREVGCFKSVRDASKKLGIPAHYISNMLSGRQSTAGGLIFVRSKDVELVKRIMNE